MVVTERMEFDDFLGHEGPTLLDFRLDCAEFELGINGPKLLFTALEVRTSLHLQYGCDYAALREFIDAFTVTAFCGHSPPEDVAVRIAASAVTPYVLIDVGPSSMYMSQLRFRTNGGETFSELCDHTLNPLHRTNYLVALVPIINQGIGHSGHRPPSHDHASAPMASATEAVSEGETLRPKYRIEYVLNRNRGNN